MMLSDREAIARKVERALEGKEYSVIEMAHDLIRLARHPVWEQAERCAERVEELEEENERLEEALSSMGY